VSVATVHAAEAGVHTSIATWIRITEALGLDLSVEVGSVDRRAVRRRDADIVHALMGECEVSLLAAHDLQVATDEPWQHYQFAGRADVLAWDVATRQLLHIENRTQFPDVQDAVGRFRSAQRFLAGSVADRVGISHPRSETHVMVALWSAEVLRVIRRSPSTFRAVDTGGRVSFDAWLAGEQAPDGRHMTLVLFDPFATGRRRRFASLDDALDGVRSRVATYAQAADLIRAMETARTR
jgi:hypothetical protein